MNKELNMTENEKKIIASRIRNLYFLSNIRDDEKRMEWAREEYGLFLYKLNHGYFDDKKSK